MIGSPKIPSRHSWQTARDEIIQSILLFHRMLPGVDSQFVRAFASRLLFGKFPGTDTRFRAEHDIWPRCLEMMSEADLVMIQAVSERLFLGPIGGSIKLPRPEYQRLTSELQRLERERAILANDKSQLRDRLGETLRILRGGWRPSD